MSTRAINFFGLLLTALVMGVFWGTWFTLTRSLDDFSAGEFLHIGQTVIANVAWPMRFLLPASIAFIGWSLVVHPARKSNSFRILVCSLVAMVLTLLITLLVEVPIDDQIRQWTVDNIAADWTDQRAIWKEYHGWRTLSAVLSFAGYAWAVLTWPHHTAKA